jgi:GntR family transcriptional regulator / MocR family aminotransferase
LVGEGYLEARPRSGLFVVEGLVKHATAAPPPKTTAPFEAPAKRAAKLLSELPFRHSRPDVRLFPLQSWARTHSRCLRAHGRALLSYLPSRTLGLPLLQESLARYLRESRGVHCRASQIAITTGSQQALYVLAHLLGTAGTRSLLEDPGYGLARRAFESTPTELVPVPVDLQGAVVPPGASAPVAAIYLTPSRQFPTGASMPVARRLQWIEYAARTNAWIIEDDYDSEFRYGHAPLPCLQSLDKNGRVIYVGTMSKVLFPALRIGYAVLPEELIAGFAALREAVDDHGPVLDQLTLAEFITTGDFYRHVKRCRKAYAERQKAFLETAAREQLPFDFPHTDGGMNLAGFLNNGMDDQVVHEALFQRGIDAPPLSRYSMQARLNGLMFGFTAHTPAVIRAGLRHVGEVIRTLA